MKISRAPQGLSTGSSRPEDSQRLTDVTRNLKNKTVS